MSTFTRSVCCRESESWARQIPAALPDSSADSCFSINSFGATRGALCSAMARARFQTTPHMPIMPSPKWRCSRSCSNSDSSARWGISVSVCCLLTSRAPRLLILAVGITYLLNGMYTPFAHGLALGLLLWNSMPADMRGEVPAGAVQCLSGCGAAAEHGDGAVHSRDPVLARGVSSVHHLSMVVDRHSSACALAANRLAERFRPRN